MKTWKAKTKRPVGIFTSEVKLREANAARIAKVRKLLTKLEKEGFDENIL